MAVSSRVPNFQRALVPQNTIGGHKRVSRYLSGVLPRNGRLARDENRITSRCAVIQGSPLLDRTCRQSGLLFS